MRRFLGLVLLCALACALATPAFGATEARRYTHLRRAQSRTAAASRDPCRRPRRQRPGDDGQSRPGSIGPWQQPIGGGGLREPPTRGGSALDAHGARLDRWRRGVFGRASRRSLGVVLRRHVPRTDLPRRLASGLGAADSQLARRADRERLADPLRPGRRSPAGRDREAREERAASTGPAPGSSRRQHARGVRGGIPCDRERKLGLRLHGQCGRGVLAPVADAEQRDPGAERPTVSNGERGSSSDGSFTYIYGVEDDGAGKYVHVARVPLGELAATWQYYGATGWSNDPASASERVLAGVSNDFSVVRVGSAYELISQGSNLSAGRSTHTRAPAQPARSDPRRSSIRRRTGGRGPSPTTPSRTPS